MKRKPNLTFSPPLPFATLVSVAALAILLLGASAAYAGCTASCEGCPGVTGSCGCSSQAYSGCTCSGGGCGSYTCCGTNKKGDRGCWGGDCAINTNSITPPSWGREYRCRAATAGFLKEAAFIQTNELGSGINIAFEVAPSIPVEIKNVQYKPVSGGFTGLTYEILNSSQKSIQAIEIFLEVTDGKNISRTPQYIDSWGSGSGGIPPGAVASGPGPLSMKSSNGGVTGIKLTVAAVLFEDGTSGGEDAADFRKFIVSQRIAIQAQVANIGLVLKSGGPEAVKSALNRQKTLTRDQAFANALLQRAFDNGGISVLSSQIDYLTKLQP